MSTRWSGSVVRAAPVTPAGPYVTSAASGLWTVNQASYWIGQSNWPGTAVGDSYFYDVSLLLPGNGTNAAQNNTFLDSSTNNFTITRNGNTTQGAFSPYGSNWSNYFDGSGDYLSISSNAAFEILGASFTIECWVNLGAVVSSSYGIISKHDGTNGWILRYSSTGLVFYTTAATVSITYSFNIGQWYHIAVSSNGTTGTVYIDGVAQGSTFSTNGTQDTSSAVQIARTNTVSNDFPGYISNVRVVKGTAIYTSNFTPSTIPLTAVSGTSLLTCQSNGFKDNSTNNFAITANGNSSVQRFSPFNAPSPYSTSVIGGSGYFDGSGDYLSLADNDAFELGSSDFTIECWFYQSTSSGGLIRKRNNGDTYGSYILGNVAGSGGYGFFIASSNNADWQVVLYTTAPNLNSWNHIAATRSGNTWKVFLNGVLGDSTTNSMSVYNGSSSLYIGYDPSYGNVNGNICDARIVKGTAVYTAAFTPPTAPLTAITNTSLLCNFTNAAIYDASMLNDAETVGNAQISTAQSKFGGSSMYFDGSGDYLKFKPSDNFNFSTGALTVEFWIYYASVTGTQTIYDSNYGTAPNLTFQPTDGTMNVYVNGTSVILTSSTTDTAGSWIHYAFVRNGTSLVLYRNGTSVATGTYSGAIGSNSLPLYIGSGSGLGYNGYIDDLRITKGYARYTSNFTAPTSAFLTF